MDQLRVVIAPDSFKESMSAHEAGAAIERGVLSVWPNADTVICPMGDGGEGTLDALLSSGLYAERKCRVSTANGRTRTAAYGWDIDTRTAVIEAAQAAGLEHVPRPDRDIWRATSIGVGQLISDALSLAPRKIVLTLGGTATNDGGAGMLNALGAKFRDVRGREVYPLPELLTKLESVDLGRMDSRLDGVEFTVAFDVTNLLLGVTGASSVFGPQKGASPEDVDALDSVLTRLADITSAETGKDLRESPGAGAGGGLGWAALEVLGAQGSSGVELVADLVGLKAAVEGADLVITGEGKADGQTLSGKTAYGVAQIAATHKVPVVLLAGSVSDPTDELSSHGFDAVLATLQDLAPLDEQLERGAESLESSAANACRLIELGKQVSRR